MDINKLKLLLVEYDYADKSVSAKKVELELAIKERSNVVNCILDANEGKKKLRRDGKELTIVVRGETYFFREPAQYEFIRSVILPETERRRGPRRQRSSNSKAKAATAWFRRHRDGAIPAAGDTSSPKEALI